MGCMKLDLCKDKRNCYLCECHSNEEIIAFLKTVTNILARQVNITCPIGVENIELKAYESAKEKINKKRKNKMDCIHELHCHETCEHCDEYLELEEKINVLEKEIKRLKSERDNRED